MKTRAVGAIVAAGLLLALGLAGGQAMAAAKGPTLASLVKQTKALPRAVATPARHRRLVRLAKHARRSAKKHACVAVRDLARYRRVLGGVKLRKAKGKRARRARARLAALGPASLAVSRKLLAGKRTRRCGGGVKPSTRAETRTTVIKSDAEGMQVKVDLPAVQFVPRTGGGQTWTELKLPDSDTPSAPGTPGIPVTSSSFGIPEGATLEVEAGKTESIKMTGVDVFPAQPDVVDQTQPAPDFTAPPFDDAPFTRDKRAYDSDRPFPPAPASGEDLGAVRDLEIGGLQVPAGQYNPADGTLKLFTSVVVNVNFAGGLHAFSPVLASPWERPARETISSLLNSRVVVGPLLPSPLLTCGMEMLVITHPDTRAAADQFADAKVAQGMRTTVVEVGSGSGQIGTTAAEIQTYIRDRLTQADCIHPSYVTIMGDDDLVPTSINPARTIPSDLPYALKDEADTLPDVAVGRFIGNDNAAIATAVTKVVNYENTPPSGLWLARATIAAEFQDDDLDGREDRTFVQFAETLRDGLVARGVEVDRIYADHPSRATPLRFNNGTDLPPALKQPAFAWTGNGADISAAWNQGRFLVVHRDHGWSDGWWSPFFVDSDARALTNGAQLPVVLSINCSSGAYDYDETSFAGESLVNPNGGSVGVFGDTRDSPTDHNTQLALGFADALLPSVLPAEGPTAPLRTGDALVAGKLRLAGIWSPNTNGDSANEMYLWHFFGDPSMPMWGGGRAPTVLNAADIRPAYRDLDGPDPYEVDVTLPRSLAGQTISLLRDGEVIGKAVIGDGVATIRPSFGDGENLGSLRVAIDADGAQPLSVPVEGVTTLAQQCTSQTVWRGGSLVTFGALTPGVAGANVVLTYTRPDGTTFNRTVAAHPDGTWNDSITPATEDPNGPTSGTWKIRSRYAGDASHAPSSRPDCTVRVVPQGTSIQQFCPDEVGNGGLLGVTGSLSPGGDIADIVVRYTRPDTTFVEHTVQTDGNGGFSDTFAPDVGGDWKIQSRFDGDSVRGGSTTPACTVHVTR